MPNSQDAYALQTVSSFVQLVDDGYNEEALAMVVHLSMLQLTEIQRRSIHRVLRKRLLLLDTNDIDADLTLLLRELAKAGIINIIVTDSYEWTDTQCEVSVILDHLVESGLQPTTAKTLREVYSSSGDISFQIPVPFTVYINDDNSFISSVDHLHIYGTSDSSFVDLHNDGRFYLEQVVIKPWMDHARDVQGDNAYCYLGDEHDDYNVTLKVGEPPVLERLFVDDTRD